MLLSGYFLRSSLEKYNKAKNKSKIEKFSMSDSVAAINNGFSNSFYLFIVVIASIFFIMEIFLLYYAISIAIRCSVSKEERIVNFVLATVFTIPYILTKITFDTCSKEFLKNGMKIKNF